MSLTNADRRERARIALDSYLLVHDTGTIDCLGPEDAEDVISDLLTDAGHWYREQFGCSLDFRKLALRAEMHIEAEEEDED